MAEVDGIFLRTHRERLEGKRKRLAALEGRSKSECDRLSAFSMGPGCGNAGSRATHYRSMEASINRSVETIRLQREVATESAFLDAYEAGKVDKCGRRRPPSGEALRQMIAVAESCLEAGAIKGRALDTEEIQALKETLKHYRQLARKEARAAQNNILEEPF